MSARPSVLVKGMSGLTVMPSLAALKPLARSNRAAHTGTGGDDDQPPGAGMFAGMEPRAPHPGPSPPPPELFARGDDDEPPGAGMFAGMEPRVPHPGPSPPPPDAAAGVGGDPQVPPAAPDAALTVQQMTDLDNAMEVKKGEINAITAQQESVRGIAKNRKDLEETRAELKALNEAVKESTLRASLNEEGAVGKLAESKARRVEVQRKRDALLALTKEDSKTLNGALAQLQLDLDAMKLKRDAAIVAGKAATAEAAREKKAAKAAADLEKAASKLEKDAARAADQARKAAADLEKVASKAEKDAARAADRARIEANRAAAEKAAAEKAEKKATLQAAVERRAAIKEKPEAERTDEEQAELTLHEDAEKQKKQAAVLKGKETKDAKKRLVEEEDARVAEAANKRQKLADEAYAEAQKKEREMEARSSECKDLLCEVHQLRQKLEEMGDDAENIMKDFARLDDCDLSAVTLTWMRVVVEEAMRMQVRMRALIEGSDADWEVEKHNEMIKLCDVDNDEDEDEDGDGDGDGEEGDDDDDDPLSSDKGQTSPNLKGFVVPDDPNEPPMPRVMVAEMLAECRNNWGTNAKNHYAEEKNRCQNVFQPPEEPMDESGHGPSSSSGPSSSGPSSSSSSSSGPPPAEPTMMIPKKRKKKEGGEKE